MKVQIINKSKHQLPAYETELSRRNGYFVANIDEPITLKPLARCFWSQPDFYIALPEGFEAQNSSTQADWPIKKGVTVLNTPGTIDA